MDVPQNQVKEDVITLERESIILNLLTNGYMQTSAIHKQVVPRVSIQTIRRIMSSLYDHGFVSYKELPTKHGQGAGERVHYLTQDGLKLIGKEKSEIAKYIRGVQRVRSTHLRHFLATREIERLILKAISQTAYSAISTNEFNDDGILHLKLRDKSEGKIINIRSDALIKIYHNGNERLIMRVEMDMNTESHDTLLKKYKAYSLYLYEKNLVRSHAHTFPVYIVLVAQEMTIRYLISRLCYYPTAKSFLFLAVEKIQGNDLFNDALLATTKCNLVSLASLVEERDTILRFVEAMLEAAKCNQNYEIVVQSKFSHICDAFFPIILTSLFMRETLFMPDAYVRVSYKFPDKIQEILFGTTVVIRNETKDEIAEKLLPYEIFLSDTQHRNKVFSTAVYGVFVIVEQDEWIDKIWDVLQNSPIKERTRVIRKLDCVGEKILQEEVWECEGGEKISLLPKEKM